MILAHYFPPFPLSIDNQSAASDHYTVENLFRNGDGSKYYSVGGYLRDRPLPTPLWRDRFWIFINYAIEIERARLIGVDAFGVDLIQLGRGRYFNEVEMLIYTANQYDDFYIVPEPGMVSLKRSEPAELADYLGSLKTNRSIYRLPDDRMLVAPFAPDKAGVNYWRSVLDRCASNGAPIALLPVLLNPGAAAEEFAPLSYGLSSWGDRSPEGRDPKSAYGQTAHSPIWMMPVTPQELEAEDSAFWETENTSLFRHQWMQAIDKGYDLAQLVTWNDYSETSEVSPSFSTQFLFYDLAAFYGEWFKTGRAPQIETDAIYYSHRRQIVEIPGPSVAGESALRTWGPQRPVNHVEMLALLKAPARIQIKLGDRVFSRAANGGVAVFTVDAAPGRPRFSILRDGASVVELESAWEIEAGPAKFDATYVGGSSTRDVKIPYRDEIEQALHG